MKNDIKFSDRRKLQNKEIPKVTSKKDTKKWCKGKTGKEHKVVTKKYNEIRNVIYYPDSWTVQVCETCGKHLDHHFSFGEFMESLKEKNE